MGKTHKNQKGSKGPTPQLRSRTTRSSKGRLLTETASSTTQLTTQLSLLGLYPARTIGDGNCLFRALSDQLYGTPSKHHELRQQICDHIASHKARYGPFVEDERGLDAHLRVMRENATYGGHMELSAFAHMTKRDVKVIQPGLVYVIEWNAGGWEEGSNVPSEPSTSDRADTPMTPRRSRRMSSKAGSPSKNKWKAEEEKKMKLGKGYYVYEEITSEEDSAREMEEKVTLENAGPTVYVAYHDWEHFSSIRNLNGPHTGYPNVVETPPPSTEDAVQPMTARDREKEREKERKRGREEKEKQRKEKERQRRQRQKVEENENGASENGRGSSLKVKLKLPSLAASANASTANLPFIVAADSVSPSPSAAATTAKELLPHLRQQQDPSLIPLPCSRSVSPSLQYVESSLVASVLSDTNNAIPLPSSSLASAVYPEDPTVHARRAYRPIQSLEPTQRSQYRSPKRSFDESSASGTEDGVEKRTRRKMVDSASCFVQGVGVGEGDDHGDKVRFPGVGCIALEGEGDENRVGDVPDVVDIVMHVDVDGDGAETPALSAPGSSSSSPLSSVTSSATSSISDASSEADVDVDVESQADDILEADGEATSPHPHPIVPASPGLSKKAKQKYLHMHLHPVGGVGTKSLTRRQRKALGLPKPKNPATSLIDDGGLAGGSAGKIVIPGGKWKGRADQSQIMTPNAVLGVTGGGVEGEWTRNGTGRLDVRGFRELKI